MSGISTHVLDTSIGRPAAGVAVRLEQQGREGNWSKIGEGRTDADGRVKNLLPAGVPLAVGAYRLTFDSGAYFSSQGAKSFYPSISILFQVTDPAQNYHVPLLLSPFGYSTYRGT